jgi:GT2 family glycosyltransferase
MQYDIIASLVTYKEKPAMIARLRDSFLNTSLKVKLLHLDNSPTDSLKDLHKGIDNVEYYFNNADLGYGRGHNIGIRKSLGNCKYHLILNPDIYFDAGVLEKLFSYAEQHPDIGLLMPKILNPDGSTQYLCKLLPTPVDLIVRRFLPFKSYKEKHDQRFELRFNPYNVTMTVPFLSGCFMFMREEALQQTGGFDENFFMYLEDADLCRRIGTYYRTVFFPHVSVYHEYGKASYKSLRYLMHHMSSAVYYFNKWGWIWDRQRRRTNRTVLAGNNIIEQSP